MYNLIVLCTPFPFMPRPQFIPISILLLKDQTCICIKFMNCECPIENLAVDL